MSKQRKFKSVPADHPIAPVRFVVGCMTGTSLDGLDVAMVVITGRGLSLRQHCAGTHSVSLGPLKNELRTFATGKPAEALRYMKAARALGELHASAVAELCQKTDVRQRDLDFVVAHGQTIWHAPPAKRCHPAKRCQDDLPLRQRGLKASSKNHPDTFLPAATPGLSWQLFDPWPIVQRLGVPVCYDLRQADLIAGGQGAPITPLSDYVMYRKPRRTRVVANLGGICNITVLPSASKIASIQGGDIGPCNILIDGVVQSLFPGQDFDADGRIAGSGKARASLVQFILDHPFLKARAKGHGRSTGREDFNPAWVGSVLARAKTNKISPSDIVASAVAAVARILNAEALRVGADEVVLAGGGAKNEVLVNAIRSGVAPARTFLSDELGIPVDAREAIAFAVLGSLSADGVPISLPQITGSTSPGVAGVWAGK